MNLGHHTAQETSCGETGNKPGLKHQNSMGKPVMLCPFHQGDLVSIRGHGREKFDLRI